MEPSTAAMTIEERAELGARHSSLLIAQNHRMRLEAARRGNVRMLDYCGDLIFDLACVHTSFMRILDESQRRTEAPDDPATIPTTAPAQRTTADLSSAERACDWIIRLDATGEVMGSFCSLDRANEYAQGLQTRRGLACSVVLSGPHALRRPDDRPKPKASDSAGEGHAQR